MKKSILLVVALLSGCAHAAAVRDCREQVGPEPNAALNQMGLIGFVLEGDPQKAQEESNAYSAKVTDCVHKWEAAHPED